MRTKIRALVYKAAAGFDLPYAFSLSALLFAVCFFLFAFSPAVEQITWKQTNGPYWGDVRAIVIDSSNGEVFAGGTFDGANPDNWIISSTDDGETWTQFNSGLTNHGVWALAINSKTQDVLSERAAAFFDSWIKVIV